VKRVLAQGSRPHMAAKGRAICPIERQSRGPTQWCEVDYCTRVLLPCANAYQWHGRRAPLHARPKLKVELAALCDTSTAGLHVQWRHHGTRRPHTSHWNFGLWWAGVSDPITVKVTRAIAFALWAVRAHGLLVDGTVFARRRPLYIPSSPPPYAQPCVL
jgi:hypothetical protein